MAVDAVWSEPLSHRYSLQTGKLTGKSQGRHRLRMLNFSDKLQIPLDLMVYSGPRMRNKTGNNFRASGNRISLIRDVNTDSLEDS
jgi:hypothetical protein